MRTLVNILVYLLIPVPTVLEAFVIDPAYWAKRKSDKPGSTRIRGVMVLIVGVLMDLLGVGVWYFNTVAAVTFHILTFAILINLKLSKPIDYLGGGRYDLLIKKVPLWLRLVLSGLLFIGSIFLIHK